MDRECVKFPLDKFLEENKESLLGLKLIKVELFIDKKNYKEIIEFLKKNENKKRFRIILIHILQNKYNDLIYRREPISKKVKDITAMKFSGGSNPRIYCKEFFLSTNDIGKKIVMIHLLENKDFNKASNNKIKSKLENLSDYEYKF